MTVTVFHWPSAINANTVYAIPAEVENPADTARVLAQLLELEEEFIMARLRKRSACRVVEKESIRRIGLANCCPRFTWHPAWYPRLRGFILTDQ